MSSIETRMLDHEHGRYTSGFVYAEEWTFRNRPMERNKALVSYPWTYRWQDVKQPNGITLRANVVQGRLSCGKQPQARRSYRRTTTEGRPMNKVARRKAQLNAHYKTLERLAVHCGVKEPNGKKLSLALWKLEQEAHQAATDYCNGQDRFGKRFGCEDWEQVSERVSKQVQALFNGKLDGLHINGDARGYALKIQTEAVSQYATVRLHTDWGGYGILSPELDGEYDVYYVTEEDAA